MKFSVLRRALSPITAASLAAVLMLVGMLRAATVVQAAPAAQADVPVIGVLALDSTNFPYVAVTLSITNSAGGPITGLTATDFTVTEDGIAVSPEKVSVEAVQGEPLSLVIALDSSVDWQSFDSIRDGVKALVDGLGPNDQVALVVFGETVQSTQDFTTDKAAIKATLDSLVAEGVGTALNDAALQAVSAAATALTPNRDVLLITNSGDRSGDSSAADAVAQAQSHNVHIHTVGYGQNAATDALAAISEATGGQSFSFGTAAGASEGLADSYASVRGLLYQLTFYSGLRADNQSHTAVIALNQDAIQAQTSASFVAVSNEINVSVPGIEDGQSVVGKVFLVAEVTSVTPVSSVEYLLNGQPIATVTSEPYSFEWDSTTVNPGTYQLTVRATDPAGNQGERSITLTVQLPFAVQIRAETDRAQVGDDVSIDATVDTPAHVIQVDLLVDNQVIASDTEKPYSFTFNTKPFPVGMHTLTVRATDLLGRTAEASLPMRFSEAVAPIVVRWAFAALIAIAIIVSFIVGLAIMGAASRAGKNKLFRVVGVELTNDGNTRSRYELRADDPNAALSYEFSLNGEVLSQRQAIEALPPAQAPTGAGVTATPATVTANSSASRGKGAVGGARSVLRVGSTIGGIISSVGYYLPGSIGTSIASFGYTLSGGENVVNRAEREVSTVKHVGSEAGSLKGAATGSPVSSTTTTTAGNSRNASPSTKAGKSGAPTMAGITRLWSQTPPIEPGQTLPVALTMRPQKGQGGQQYFFRVISQAIDAEDTAPVIEQGNITIKGISIFQRLLPFVILILTLGLMALLVALLALTIGLFG